MVLRDRERIRIRVRLRRLRLFFAQGGFSAHDQSSNLIPVRGAHENEIEPGAAEQEGQHLSCRSGSEVGHNALSGHLWRDINSGSDFRSDLVKQFPQLRVIRDDRELPIPEIHGCLASSVDSYRRRGGHRYIRLRS
jgi:hypothetical protein